VYSLTPSGVWGGKPPKKSRFRRHLAGSKMPKETRDAVFLIRRTKTSCGGTAPYLGSPRRRQAVLTWRALPSGDPAERAHGPRKRFSALTHRYRALVHRAPGGCLI